MKKNEVIEKDLYEYNRNKIDILKYIDFKNQNRLPKEFEWIVNEHKYSEASKILKKNIRS